MRITASALVAAAVLGCTILLSGCASEEEKICKQAHSQMLGLAGNLRVAESAGDYVARCTQMPAAAHACLTLENISSANVGTSLTAGCKADMYPKLKSGS